MKCSDVRAGRSPQRRASRDVLGKVLGTRRSASARILETCSETWEEVLGDVPRIDRRATRNSEKSLSVLGFV